MRVRIVTTILISAILACPMWCVSGICYGLSCSGERPVSADRTESKPVPKRCCRHCNKSDSQEDAPAPVPEDSPCQGICGGAVIDKGPELQQFVPIQPFLFAVDEVVMRPASEFATTADFGRAWPGGENVGRSLCALYMSFQC